MYRILICDDERDIVKALEIYLVAEGYDTLSAYTGKQALELIAKNEVHLVLMDVMMPELDGIAAMKRLRENHNLPVILLTAKSEGSDKVLGLDLGADDYVTKPFSPVELLARVRSQLRRYMQLGGGVTRPESYVIGGIELNDSAKRVTVDGDEVALTPTEYAILHLLMQNPDVVMSPKEIYRRVWNDPPVGAESTIAVHVRHLREKIEINPAEPRYLKVVWGKGYRFSRMDRD